MRKPPDLEALTDSEQLARAVVLHLGLGVMAFAALCVVQKTLLWVPLIVILLYMPGYVWRRRVSPFWQASRAMMRGDYRRAADEFGRLAAELEAHPELLRGQQWLDFHNVFPYLQMARINAGVCRLKLEQADQAEALFQRVVRDEPANYLAINNLGMVCWKRGERDAAIRHFSHALDTNRYYEPARINLGESYLEQGCYQEAEATLNAVAASARDARYEYLRAKALLGLGRKSDARAHCTLGVRFNPEHEPLRELMQQIEAEGVTR